MLADELRDKAVLITGAGRGIGKRLALGFAAAGARVGLLARSKAELNVAKLEIEHAGGNALVIQSDVCDAERMSAAADLMEARFGGLDILICAAAIHGPIGPFVDAKPAAWREAVETNLLGVVNSCHAVLPAMIQRRQGKIIVLTGGGAAYGRPNFSAYASTKAAVVRFIETVAEEVREHNVQMNALGPGGAYTHMTDEIINAGKNAGHKEVEEARRVRLTGGVPPEKQIQLAMFLSSGRSNHISGKFLHVKDDWKKLENANMDTESYTLRRLTKV
jgi:NAD(P)-dependent dehydrogenase (short-subunit alcohol dehydrogenase family)